MSHSSRNKMTVALLATALITVLLLVSRSSAMAMDITMAWEKNKENDVTQYHVYYSTTTFKNHNKPATFQQIAADFSDPALNARFPGTDPARNMIVTLAGLPNPGAGQRYYIGVTAIAESGGEKRESDLSEILDTIADNPGDAGAPSSAVLSHDPPTTSSVTLKWNRPYDDLGIARFELFRASSIIRKIDTPVGDLFSHEDTGLAAGRTYTYKVLSYDAAGHFSTSNQLNVAIETDADVNAPTAPGDVREHTIGSNDITIRWNASQDNQGAAGAANTGVAHYIVTMTAASDNTTKTVPHRDNQTTFTCAFSGLTPKTTYTFRVRAVDKAAPNPNVSADAPAHGLSLTTLPEPEKDTEKPARATFTHDSLTQHSVRLLWNKPSDNVGVTRFALTRLGLHREFTATGNDNYNFADTGLTPATRYDYTLYSCDAANNCSQSALSVTTLPTADNLPPDTPEDLTAIKRLPRVITIEWNAVEDNPKPGGSGVAYYHITSDTPSSEQRVVHVDGKPTYQCTFNNLTPNQDYTFALRAVDKASPANIGDAIQKTFTTPAQSDEDTVSPQAPDPTAPADQINSDRIGLRWPACADNPGGSGISHYIVYRIEGDNHEPAGETTETRFIVTGLKPNTRYSFRVAAVDNSGNTAMSPIIAATTASSDNDSSGGGGGCFILSITNNTP